MPATLQNGGSRRAPAPQNLILEPQVL